MNKITKSALAVAMGLSLAACTPAASASSKTYEAVGTGFGGEVKVTVTYTGDKITEAVINADSETPAVGGAAAEKLAEQIVAAQSADIDGVSGATMTTNAVKEAMTKILAEINGTEGTSAVLKDGVYTAATWGFSKNYQLNVEVTVEGGKMTKIEVKDNGETEIILNTAIEYLIPSMIEHQSVKVDSTTGATTSSTAIKLAVEDCLVQALEDPSAITAFYTVPEKSTAQETLETDILVVGMGGAGITTAIRAKEANPDAKVLMIDKAAKYGGTSVTTTSPMSINPSSFVKENNGENFVDVDVLKADWMNYTEGDAAEWAIDVMMDHSGEAVDYLLTKGFVFGAPTQGLSAPYKLCTNYGNEFAVSKSTVQTYFDSFIDSYVEQGGEYMLQVEATDLIVNNGTVTGVKAAAADGTSYTINAKAVVLATGGFAGNGEMEDEYLSNEYYNLAGGGQWNVFGMTQNDGKMIQSAIDNGAATYNIGMPPVSHIGGAYMTMHEYPVIDLGYEDIWTKKNATMSLNDVPVMMAVAPNCLAVNRQGVRFVDETSLASYGNWAAGAYWYSIYSAEQLKSIETEGLQFSTIGIFINQGGWPANQAIPEIYEIMDKGIEMGYIFKADTLEDLAKQINVDASTLTKTVSDYNTYCDTKENPADGVVKSSVVYDLSGTPMEGDYNTFAKVEGDGPYYAIMGAPYIYSTTGALEVNEQFQVVNTNGEAISGLYAAGTDCLGMLFTEKKEYVTYGGADQGWAFTSGYLAGPIVAEAVK